MKKRNLKIRLIVYFSVALILMSPLSVISQTKVEPGINFFSIEQDVEIGRRSAEEAERQLPILRDSAITEYIDSVGRGLAKNSSMPNLPWQFKVVNSPEVNAFALPGGFIYVNRGLIEAARNEAELAGVLSHEISHVTLRHGTNQLSKAVLAQAPLAVVGGVLGEGVGSILTKLGISFGLNAIFLRYSRTAETQADVVGVQLLTRTGYAPQAMVSFFQKLQNMQKGEPSKVAEFFSSHPNPANRISRINQEISLLRPSANPVTNTRGFDTVRAQLQRMPAAQRSRNLPVSSRTGGPEPPSRSYSSYTSQQGEFRISYPSNWKVYDSSGSSVMFLPDGGVAQVGDQQHITHGAIINFFTPSQEARRRSSSEFLRQATDELVASVQQDNRYLRVVRGPQRHGRIDGEEALSVTLSGASPLGHQEVAKIFTRRYQDDLLYIIAIAPEREFDQYDRAFSDMLQSMRIGQRR